jgi:hypothetical protein
MTNLLENIAENDPLVIPEKKAVIDQILEENKDLPGATMVVLNQIQSQIGFITEPMQAYVARQLHVSPSAIHGVVSFTRFSLPSRAAATRSSSAWALLATWVGRPSSSKKPSRSWVRTSERQLRMERSLW